MKKWLEAFRLRTLPLSLSTIIMGGACAHYTLGDNNYNWTVFILAITTTIFLQILSNLANDYGDFEKGTDNENRIGPMRTMQAGLIAKKEMQIALLIFVLLSLISGIFLLVNAFDRLNYSFLLLFVLGILAIAAAMKYTMGTSAYGYRGLGDIFVFVFFGIVGVLGTYFLLTQELNLYVFLPAASMGLLATTVLNLNNMRDHENDEKAGKRTIVVKLGLINGKRYHTFLFVAAYFGLISFIFLFLKNDIFYLVLLPFLVLHSLHLKKVKTITKPSDFDPYLKVIALSTFGLSLAFGTILFLQ